MRKTFAFCLCLVSLMMVSRIPSVYAQEEETSGEQMLSFSPSSENDNVPLTSGWTYSLVDPAENSSAVFSDLPFSAISNLEKMIPGGSGYIYLKKNFKVPSSLKGQNLGCYLGRITMADQTYLNGVFIGETGRMPPSYFSAWNTVRFYIIPEEILNEDKNEILVKIWVDGEGSIVSNPFIGSIGAARKAASAEEFWNSRIQLAFAFIMIIIAWYNVLLFFKQNKKTEYMMYAVINLLSAVYMSVFYICQIPWLPTKGMSFLWFEKIIDNSLMFVFPFLVTSYINAFFHRKESTVALCLRSACVIFPIIIVLMVPSYPVLHSMRLWLQALLVPPMLYILYIIIHCATNRNKETKPLLWGMSPLVFAVVFDLITHNMLHLYSLPYITTIGWQLVIISLLFIMTNRLSESMNEIEDLNKNLEKKVNDRTKELTESNEKLNSSIADLNYANGKLEEERVRAEKDMKLAVYVQQSFYPKKAPAVEGWDIAYHFQPATGVSGDLYDFFTDGSKFKGLGLFDVSGHGISAGLVGMIAKGVIERIFEAEGDEPFSKVMNDINREFIIEKGDVENYITGVLLRVNENRIEFVNAGHPPVLYRTSSGKRVIPVQVPGSENNMTDTGSIVGVDGLPANYKPIGFAMNPGDSIILYTDCLNESRSKDGQVFGTEGIAKAFAESGNGTAEEKLQHVLKEFNSFTEDTLLNDDLTVIVLQKK